MTSPKNRSNSVRKIKYRVPAGVSRVRYRRRVKGKAHRCALTGDKLSGVHALSSLTPSRRRPKRKFAGRLSPSATKRVLIYRSRLEQGLITLEQVPVQFLPYVSQSKK